LEDLQLGLVYVYKLENIMSGLCEKGEKEVFEL